MASLTSQAPALVNQALNPALTDGIAGSSPDVPHVHVGLQHHITRVIRRRRRRASGTQLAAMVAMSARFHTDDRRRSRTKDLVDRINQLSRSSMSVRSLIYFQTGTPRARRDASAGLSKLTRAGLHVQQRMLQQSDAGQLPVRWKEKIDHAVGKLDYVSMARRHQQAAAPSLSAAGLDKWLRTVLDEPLPTDEASRRALQDMVCLALRMETTERVRTVRALVAALSETQRRAEVVDRAWLDLIDMIDRRVEHGESIGQFVAGMVRSLSDFELAVLANDVVPDRWRAGPAPRDSLVRRIQQMDVSALWAERHARVVETLQFQLAMTTAERMQHSSFGPGEARVIPMDGTPGILVPRLASKDSVGEWRSSNPPAAAA